MDGWEILDLSVYCIMGQSPKPTDFVTVVTAFVDYKSSLDLN